MISTGLFTQSLDGADPASQVFGFSAILLLAGRAVEDPVPAVWAGVLVHFQGSSRGR